MSTITTPDMGLLLAAVSETLGPLWAQYINDAFTKVDAHDHTSGNGVKITQAGLNITANFDLLNFALLNALYVTLSNAGVSADTSKTGSFQRVGGNLWWVNTAGVGVQITNGNSVISSGSGAITISGPGSFPYTVLSTDAQKVLVVDSSTGAKTLNLPAATTSMFFMIKDSGGLAQTNNISVVPNGTDSIDGFNTTYLIDANYASVGLISDGVSKWHVV